MFVRPCWKPRAIEDAYRLVDDYPWALLISNRDDGPLATNLPLLLDRTRGDHGVLTGHIARANDHARALLFDTQSQVLAVFHGPSSYVTPSWYPNRDMPGTYYYMAVHCYGRIKLQLEADLEAALTLLTDCMEAAVPNGWRMDEVPHSEITRRLPAILGFELDIERIEAKFKLGQDEPRKDAMAVAEHLAASSDPSQRALAVAVRKANQDRSK